MPRKNNWPKRVALRNALEIQRKNQNADETLEAPDKKPSEEQLLIQPLSDAEAAWENDPANKAEKARLAAKTPAMLEKERVALVLKDWPWKNLPAKFNDVVTKVIFPFLLENPMLTSCWLLMY